MEIKNIDNIIATQLLKAYDSGSNTWKIEANRETCKFKIGFLGCKEYDRKYEYKNDNQICFNRASEKIKPADVVQFCTNYKLHTHNERKLIEEQASIKERTYINYLIVDIDETFINRYKFNDTNSSIVEIIEKIYTFNKNASANVPILKQDKMKRMNLEDYIGSYISGKARVANINPETKQISFHEVNDNYYYILLNRSEQHKLEQLCYNQEVHFKGILYDKDYNGYSLHSYSSLYFICCSLQL